jgi:NNP family nitrate/nitrite transporter-like MFS transporter
VALLGVSDAIGWRLCMVIAGVLCALTGIAYYFVTQDTPEGNFAQLRAEGKMPARKASRGSFLEACCDYRVWALFVVYGACFGIELTINNIAALYFHDYFDLGLASAGLVASLFGLMNIFARTLGGVVGDKWGIKWGLKGRVWFMGLILFLEGIALMLFSQQTVLPLAIGTLMLFSLFVQMSEGATYSVVPFVNKKALGAVAGIVGAGGNAGAVAAGFLFKMETLSWPQALLILGAVVTVCSGFARDHRSGRLARLHGDEADPRCTLNVRRRTAAQRGRNSGLNRIIRQPAACPWTLALAARGTRTARVLSRNNEET